MNRTLAIVFAGLTLLLQYPLWFGKGGWLRAWDLDRQVAAQQKVNDGLKRRNAGLEAEVKDLKNGLEAIEERARFELGMVKESEVFFHILEAPPVVATAASPAAPAPSGRAPGATKTPAPLATAPATAPDTAKSPR